tara:strand:+ start:387 stop:548 length:162 start_codon:yes stop_codon:yes gene_type:complete
MDSWEAWYLDFEEINELLDRPIPISKNDMIILVECFKRGLTADEAIDNFLDLF